VAGIFANFSGVEVDAVFLAVMEAVEFLVVDLVVVCGVVEMDASLSLVVREGSVLCPSVVGLVVRMAGAAQTLNKVVSLFMQMIAHWS